MTKKTKESIAIMMIWAFPVISHAQSTVDQTVCLGEESEYLIENAVKESSYRWSIEGNDGTQNIKSQASTIKVIWDKTGEYNLCVQEVNDAGCEGPVNKLKVKVEQSPSAEFDNAMLCYGEQLSIKLNGEVPYAVEYTINGNSEEISDINSSEYKLPVNKPGKYIITKVTDKNCSTKPKVNNSSIIGNEIKTLIIKH